MTKMKTKRKTRKKVGDRDAASGRFVSIEYAEANPETTVAVTVEEPTAQEAAEAYVNAIYREQGDAEC